MGNLIPIWQLPIGSHIGPSRGGSKSHQKNKSSTKRVKSTKCQNMCQKVIIFGLMLSRQNGSKSDIILKSAHLGARVAPKTHKLSKSDPKVIPNCPKVSPKRRKIVKIGPQGPSKRCHTWRLHLANNFRIFSNPCHQHHYFLPWSLQLAPAPSRHGGGNGACALDKK